jgi:hypothetical protein
MMIGRRQILRLAAALLLGGLAQQLAAAQEPVYDAAEVKAAFLYHFGTYVTWPTPARDRPLRIAVLGDEVVAAQLARFLPGRRIEGRPVEVRAIAATEDLADEEIVFIGSANNSRLAQVIAATGPKPVLVVTDAPNGLDSGAMINFQQVESRLRFEISMPRAEERGLILSSRLLAAALRVVTSQCCHGAEARFVASVGTRRAVAARPARATRSRPVRAAAPVPSRIARRSSRTRRAARRSRTSRRPRVRARGSR